MEHEGNPITGSPEETRTCDRNVSGHAVQQSIVPGAFTQMMGLVNSIITLKTTFNNIIPLAHSNNLYYPMNPSW